MNPITSIFRNKSRAETVLVDTLGNKMFGFLTFIYLFIFVSSRKQACPFQRLLRKEFSSKYGLAP